MYATIKRRIMLAFMPAAALITLASGPGVVLSRKARRYLTAVLTPIAVYTSLAFVPGAYAQSGAPPERCDWVHDLKPVFDRFTGNFLGLSHFAAKPIILSLVAIAILVAGTYWMKKVLGIAVTVIVLVILLGVMPALIATAGADGKCS